MPTDIHPAKSEDFLWNWWLIAHIRYRELPFVHVSLIVIQTRVFSIKIRTEVNEFVGNQVSIRNLKDVERMCGVFPVSRAS